MRIVNVSKSYEKKVLDNINLEFNKCGLYLIHGESGVGKSTLFRIINGLEEADEGYVEIDSNESISYCSSDNQLIEHIKVKDMLSILSKDKEEINNLLDIFEIKSLKRKKINKLSSGERERLQIVLTLLKDTNVIFLDEPTENLDNKTTIKVLNYLKELSKEKIIVLISHDIKNVIEYADQIYLLENASLIEEKNYVGTKEPLATTSKELNKKGLINYSFKNLFKHPIIMMLNLLLIFTIYLIVGYLLLTISIDNNKTFQKIGENLEYTFIPVGANDEQANEYHLLSMYDYDLSFAAIEYETVKDYIDLNNPYNSFYQNYDLEAFDIVGNDICIPCIIQNGCENISYSQSNSKTKLGDLIRLGYSNYYLKVVGVLNQQLDKDRRYVIISSKIDKFIYENLGIIDRTIYNNFESAYYKNGNKFGSFLGRTTFKYIDDIEDIKDYCININEVTDDYKGYFYVGEFPKNDNEIMLNQPYLYASLNENNKIDLLDDSKICKYLGIDNELNCEAYKYILNESINGLKITGTIGYVDTRVVYDKNYNNCYVSHNMYEKMCNSLKDNDYHYYSGKNRLATKESFKYLTPDFFDDKTFGYYINFNTEYKLTPAYSLGTLALIMVLVELIFVRIIFDDTLRDIQVLELYYAKKENTKCIILFNYFFKTIFRVVGFLCGLILDYQLLKKYDLRNSNITPVFSIWIIILVFIISLLLSLIYELGIYKLRRNKVLSKHE